MRIIDIDLLLHRIIIFLQERWTRTAGTSHDPVLAALATSTNSRILMLLKWHFFNKQNGEQTFEECPKQLPMGVLAGPFKATLFTS
jgi:hypothetical protein